MPTYRNRQTGEVRTVASPDELLQPVAAHEPPPPVSGLERVKNFLTSRGTLATAGTIAGLALAPEASIPAAMLYGAFGGGIGSLAAQPFKEKPPSPGEVMGDIGLGAVEGAATPVLGPAMGAPGRGLARVGQAIPRLARTGGALTGLAMGHPGALTLEALLNPNLAPRALQAGGRVVESGVNKVIGSARRPLERAAQHSKTLEALEGLRPYAGLAGQKAAAKKGLADLTETPVTRVVDEGLPFWSNKPTTWVTKGHLDEVRAAQLNDMYKSGKGTVIRSHVKGPVRFPSTDEFGNAIGEIPTPSLEGLRQAVRGDKYGRTLRALEEEGFRGGQVLPQSTPRSLDARYALARRMGLSRFYSGLE